MSEINTNKWSRPAQPPSPLFANDKERSFVKQVNDELIERVIGQPIMYYPISLEHSNYHSLYGEAINKTYLPPVRVYVLVAWEGLETKTINGTLDKVPSITIHFHKRRLTEDQELYAREGDYVLYNETFYEIIKLNEPKVIWGNQPHKMEIEAKCIKARQGNFTIIDA